MTVLVNHKFPRGFPLIKIMMGALIVMVALLGETEAMQNRIATRRAVVFSQQAEAAAKRGDLEGTKAALSQIESFYNSHYPIIKAAVASAEVQQILHRTVQAVAEVHLKAAEEAQESGEAEKVKISLNQMEDTLKNLPPFITGPLALPEQFQKRVENIAAKAEREARKNEEDEYNRQVAEKEREEAIRRRAAELDAENRRAAEMRKRQSAIVRPVEQTPLTHSHQDGRSFASSLMGNVAGAAKSTNPREIPGFQTDRPQEASLNAASLGEAALQASRTNEAAQYLISEAKDRKSFKIDPNTDPLFVGANEVVADPQKVMNEEFIETTGSEEDVSEEVKTCEESGEEYQKGCSKILEIKLKITPEVRTPYSYCPGHAKKERKGCSLHYSHWTEYCSGCATGVSVTPKNVEVVKEEWVDGCTVLEGLTEKGLCRYISKTTSPKDETRTIKGEPVTRDHFEEHFQYACFKTSPKSCAGLREKGCYQVNSTCKEKIGDVCVLWEQTYRCPSGKRSLKSFRSSNKSNPYCLTGNCADTSYEANGEMMNVMSQLAALGQVQKDLRDFKVIFRGEDRRCTRHCVGFKDCCGPEGGWGVTINLAECDKDETELRDLRNRNLCVQVGTYCAEKKLGVCLRKKTSFCCYGTKMARLIQQNGRTQLGIGFGAPDAPNCSGLSTEELSRIDFSKIDFSEVFEDITSKMVPKGQQQSLAKVSTTRIQENMTLLTKPSLNPQANLSTQELKGRGF